MRFPRATHLVVMCRHEAQAKGAFRHIRIIMDRLDLVLHSEKTRIVRPSYGKASFEFLGRMVRKRRSIQRNSRLRFVQKWSSPKAKKHIRTRVHELNDVRSSPSRNMRELIELPIPVLYGWGNYFVTGNSEAKFNQLDSYIWNRVIQWQYRRGRQHTSFHFDRWPFQQLWYLGLHLLRGTVKHPANAMSRKPSVSRVRENRMRGLKGGAGNRPLKAVPRP